MNSMYRFFFQFRFISSAHTENLRVDFSGKIVVDYVEKREYCTCDFFHYSPRKYVPNL